jgi:hypothetical protein
MQEAINEANSHKKPLYITILDAKAAFYVMDQKSLLRKLFSAGITGATWTVLAETFKDARSVVKWQNRIF